MYGPFQKARHVLRGGAALVLALLLCAAMPARAAGVTAGGADQDTSARMLVPVGHTVGIKLFARGVMVVKAPESGTPADDCGLQTGDIIVKCGGVSVTSSEQFQSLLQENGETATDLQVRREGGSVTLSVSPEQNEKGAYCIGAWIRDSMAGIGTMTYYDPESGAFGALGSRRAAGESRHGGAAGNEGGALQEVASIHGTTREILAHMVPPQRRILPAFLACKAHRLQCAGTTLDHSAAEAPSPHCGKGADRPLTALGDFSFEARLFLRHR